jgi:hypothetical protein
MSRATAKALTRIQTALTEAAFQFGFSARIGLRQHAVLQLLGCCHALLRELDDRIRLVAFPVIGHARLGHAPAEFIQVLLHSAQLGLGRRMRVPLHDRFDRTVDRLLGFYPDQVSDKAEHALISRVLTSAHPIIMPAFGMAVAS